jgi:hypothetical protein
MASRSPRQGTVELVEGKGLPQLLSSSAVEPGAHIAVQHASAIMGEHQKHVKQVETGWWGR